MRRLARQQLVEIDLENEDRILRCRVEAVAGAVATLRRVDGTSFPPAGATLGPSGYLVFEHRGQLVALRGIAALTSTDEPTLDFVVTDGVQLPERRDAPRLALAVPARVAVLDDDGNSARWIETTTANISRSGALLERPDGVDPASEFKIELLLGPEAGPQASPVTCMAKLARATPTHIGVKFDEMPEADRVRLSAVIASYG